MATFKNSSPTDSTGQCKTVAMAQFIDNGGGLFRAIRI
jgi:hypothetical protein